MPVQFCTYLTGYIKAFLSGNFDDSIYSNKRTISPNEYVDKNKIDYCTNGGYSNQEKVCDFCGSKKKCDELLNK